MFAVQPIVVTYTSTPGLVLRSYRACHRTAVTMQWSLSVAWLIVGVVLHMWIFVVTSLLAPLMVEFQVRRRLRPYLQGPRTVTITITEDEYRVQGPDRATSRTWTTVRDVRRRGEFWVFRLATAGAMAFRAGALNDADDEAFRDLIRRRSLLR
jgi:hypothetical protein